MAAARWGECRPSNEISLANRRFLLVQFFSLPDLKVAVATIGATAKKIKSNK